MKRCHVQRGFTLLELIVVISLVAILVAVGLDRLRNYQELAEAAAAESNLAMLKSTLLIRSAELAAGNRWNELRRLPRHDPFELFADKPANFDGYLSRSSQPGRWYFDEVSASVVYRVERGEAFYASDGSREMRFNLVGRGAFGEASAGGAVAYVALRPQAEYRWFNRLIR